VHELSIRSRREHEGGASARPWGDRRRAHVVVLDDGSARRAPASLCEALPEGIAQLEVLRLRRNLGHQRALAVGLAWAEEQHGERNVVVMDGDGEDDPRDVPRLLAALEDSGRQEIVFAARARRAEGALYWMGYQLYRGVHRVLTGIPVRFGNFSAIPPARLRQVVVLSELWNHYAAAVVHARLPRRSIPADRAPRLAGRTRMGFTALVIHGMSAMSVFADVIGVRLLVASAALALAALALALTGWASGPAALPLALTALVVLPLGVGLFLIATLQSRSGVGFLPCRDYRWFLEFPPGADG